VAEFWHPTRLLEPRRTATLVAVTPVVGGGGDRRRARSVRAADGRAGLISPARRKLPVNHSVSRSTLSASSSATANGVPGGANSAASARSVDR
jgi:hypothetical protein